MRDWKEIGAKALGQDQKAVQPQRGADEPAIHASLTGGRLSVLGAREHLGAYGGENAIDWVMDCLDLIAQTASSAGYHFEREGQTLVPLKTDKTAADIEEAPQDLVNLLRYPNPWQTWQELIELMVIDFLLVGNAFWLKYKTDDEGKPLSLYRLHPELVEVKPGAKRLVDKYIYHPAGQIEPFEYDPEQVVHFRRPNPRSEHVGLGIVAGAPRVFDIELAMTESMAAYYENGTRLSGVIETDRTVTPQTFQKVKRMVSTMYSGARNSYKVPVFERGMKWKTISGTAAEAEYRHLAPQSRDRIVSMFRVPKPLLGLGEGFDRASVREAHRIFDNKTMRPFLNRLQAVITQALTQPGWGVDFVIDYAYVMPVEDRLDLGQAFASIPGVTVREVREQVGLEALGEDRLDDDGKVIDDIVLNMPGDNDNASKIKDRNLGSEAGRPPKGENTAAFDDGAQPDARVR